MAGDYWYEDLKKKFSLSKYVGTDFVNELVDECDSKPRSMKYGDHYFLGLRNHLIQNLIL